jgi:hypothetical protein
MDLDALGRLFGEGPATVKKHGEHHYLEISSPDPDSTNADTPADSNDDDALAVPREQLARMNGIALMIHENHRPPRVEGITTNDPHTGELITRISLRLHTEARSRVYQTLCVKNADGSVTSDPSSTVGEDILRLSGASGKFMRVAGPGRSRVDGGDDAGAAVPNDTGGDAHSSRRWPVRPLGPSRPRSQSGGL